MKTIAKIFILASVFAAPLVIAAEPDTAKKPTAEVKYKTPELHRAQIDEWIGKPDKVLFLDIRRPDELITYGSFPVYLNVQLADLEKNLEFIPKDRSIITVSNHANRAFRAGDLLSSKGFKVIGAAGSENYEKEGGTFVKKIVKPEPKPVAANQ